MIEEDPKNFFAYFRLGLHHRKNNNNDDALVCFEKVEEINQEFNPEIIQLHIGEIYEEKKEYEKAITHL